MKGRVFWIIALAVIIAGFYFLFLRKPEAPGLEVTENTPQITDEMKSSFGVLIDDNAEKTELVDVTGGMASAIATRIYENGVFTHAVLADLPDPTSGTFYEGWLVRGKAGDSDFDFISTGKMQLAKGGYVLEFESQTDLSDYAGVVVTLETKLDDVPEEHILEGSF